jgi:hypothetical protein
MMLELPRDVLEGETIRGGIASRPRDNAEKLSAHKYPLIGEEVNFEHTRGGRGKNYYTSALVVQRYPNDASGDGPWKVALAYVVMQGRVNAVGFAVDVDFVPEYRGFGE